MSNESASDPTAAALLESLDFQIMCDVGRNPETEAIFKILGWGACDKHAEYTLRMHACGTPRGFKDHAFCEHHLQGVRHSMMQLVNSLGGKMPCGAWVRDIDDVIYDVVSMHLPGGAR